MGEQASHSVKARNAGAKKHNADVKDTRIAQPNPTAQIILQLSHVGKAQIAL
jgi:hypothetical protein